MTPADYLSPKQVARAIGVSESSLKRWCDQGFIETVRTAGGHRKILVNEVMRFIREHRQTVVSRDVLGLPPVSELSQLSLSRGRPMLLDALLDGNEPVALQILLDLHIAKHSYCNIFDEVLAGAFADIGHRWSCNTAEVFQERRACELAQRFLHEARRMQPAPSAKWSAIGGTLEGDSYSLPTKMAEIVLREADFQAESLGVSIPAASLAEAVRRQQPHLFWLSVSHVPENVDVVAQVSVVAQVCSEQGVAFVIGGRALTADLRPKLNCSALCDTMRQLESFANVLKRTAGRVKHSRAASSQKSSSFRKKSTEK